MLSRTETFEMKFRFALVVALAAVLAAVGAASAAKVPPQTETLRMVT
jgi:hypothetical protein